MEGTLLVKNKLLDNGKVAPSAWTALAKIIGHEFYKEEELRNMRISRQHETILPTEFDHDSCRL